MQQYRFRSHQRGRSRAIISCSALLVTCIALTARPAHAGKGEKTSLFPEYVLADSALASQTKSDVTVTVTPLGPSRMYEHPELFAFNKDQVAEPIAGLISFDTYHKKDFEKRHWCYTFGAGDKYVAAFRVEIQNGTDHILRMKDARIYLEAGDNDPFAAVTKVGDPTLVPTSVPEAPRPKSYQDQDESLVHWVTYFEALAERERPKERFFDSQKAIPIGIASQVIALNRQAYKLIADPSAEILPGRTLKGILLFPVVVSFEEATLSLFDVHTQVDAAGNPVEKQTFTFPLRLNRVQMQFDDKKEKRWKVVGAG